MRFTIRLLPQRLCPNANLPASAGRARAPPADISMGRAWGWTVCAMEPIASPPQTI
jgi:hypothetical protein